MINKIVVSIILLVLLCVSLSAQDLSALKKRIAVVAFEDRAGYGHNIDGRVQAARQAHEAA